MFNIGTGEMIALALLALLVFGPESLPDIAKKIARTVRAVKQASADFQHEVNHALNVENQRVDAQRRRRHVTPPPTPTVEETSTGIAEEHPSSATDHPTETPLDLAMGSTPAPTDEIELSADDSAQPDLEVSSSADSSLSLSNPVPTPVQSDLELPGGLEDPTSNHDAAFGGLSGDAAPPAPSHDDDEGPGKPMGRPQPNSTEAVTDVQIPVETLS